MKYKKIEKQIDGVIHDMNIIISNVFENIGDGQIFIEQYIDEVIFQIILIQIENTELEKQLHLVNQLKNDDIKWNYIQKFYEHISYDHLFDHIDLQYQNVVEKYIFLELYQIIEFYLLILIFIKIVKKVDYKINYQTQQINLRLMQIIVELLKYEQLLIKK